MQQISQLLTLAAALSTASASAVQGFNYGSTNPDNSARMQADFETSFSTAKNLVGTGHAFTSARLYTMIQAYSTADPIQAIPAAIATNTTLLLGLWASGNGFANEITALKAAIAQYGDQGLGKLVTGISVGSEDLYRNSPTSQALTGGIGTDPNVLVGYIGQVREAIKGTALSGAPIGHVDTWDAFTNGTNAPVIQAIDWLGFDGYPYWQLHDGNSIDNGAALFQKSFAATQAAASGKPVWMTETGWAVTGPSEGEAVANTANAKTYWDTVGCNMLFGKTNTWWYTLSETGASLDFGVTNSESNTTPLYDLSCPKVTATSTSASASSVATNGVISSGSGSGSGAGATSGSNTVSSAIALTTGIGSPSGNNSFPANNATLSSPTLTATSTSSSSTATGTSVPSSGGAANVASLGGLVFAAALALFA